MNQPADGGLPDNDNLEPLFETIISTIPAPEYEEGAPLQAHVANIDSSDFLGRLGLVRIYNGTLEKGKTYGLSRVDGSLETSASPNCCAPRASSVSRSNPQAPATSWPLPALTTS